jgi:transcriptional regulator with XRE-family HTH domain
MYNKSMNIRTSLIRLRKAKGLSQQDLAKKAGLTQRQINYYEHDNSIAVLETIGAIAKALEVNISDLFDDNNHTQPSDGLDLLDIDSRTLKKIKDLLSLSRHDRLMVYSIIDGLLAKQQLKDTNKEKAS